MKKLSFSSRVFSISNIRTVVQRGALFFFVLALTFGLFEPGASQALAVSSANKTFKTDYKLSPLDSPKTEITPGLTQESGGALDKPKVDNPREHKYEEAEKRTPFTSTYVNNDGTRYMQYSTDQQNYLDGKTWKKIDNKLSDVEKKAPEANLWQNITGTQPKAPAPDTFTGKAGLLSAEIKPLSTGVTIHVGNKDITMKPVGAKDVIPERQNDSSIIYKDAWPGVDLEYELRGEAVKEIIILKNKDVRTTFDFTVSGGKVIKHPTKQGLLTIEGTPEDFSFSTLTVDVNGRGVISEERATQAATSNGIRITVDKTWLATLKSNDFPVRVDPTFYRDATSYWMYKSDGYSCGSSNCYANIGAINDGGWKNWRTYFQFPISDLAGKKILGANLHGFYKGGIGGDTAGRQIWMGHANCLGYNCRGGQVGWAGGIGTDFDINFTDGLQQSVNNSDWGTVWSLWGEEGAYKTYKPYYNLQAGVVYDTPTPIASAVTPANGQVMVDTMPTLKVNPVSDADGDKVQYYFRVSTNSDAETGAVINSGWIDTTQWTVPDGILQDGTTYYWHVYTLGATQTNPNWVRSFKVDLRTGKDSTQSYDTVGPAGIGLATGNTTLSANTHTMNALGGDIGLNLTYNTPNRAKKGLKAEYWNVAANYNFANGAPTSTPNKTLRDQAIDFNWGTGSPTSGINADWFYVRWSGQFVAPTAGTYKFGGNNDDSMKITIGGQALYNQGCYGSTVCYDESKSITLAAGQVVPIQIDYYDATSVAYAKLYVKGAVTEQIVPQDWLYTEVTNQSQAYGLTGRYYTDTGDHNIDTAATDSLRLMMVRRDTTLNVNFGTGAPAPGLQADNFLVRWTGYITVPTGGNYKLGMKGDDGARIKVKNGASWTTTLDSWGYTGMDDRWGSAVSLPANTAVPIMIDYNEVGGPASFTLRVQDTTGASMDIPTTWLTPAANALPEQWSLGVDVDGNVGYERLRVSNNSVILEDSTGSTHEYTYTNGGYKPPVNEDGTLSKNSNNTYTFIDTDGRTYIFDAEGKLTSLTSPTDDRQPAALKYTYAGDPSRLIKIEDGVTNTRYATVYYKGINEDGNICDPNSAPNSPGTFFGLGSQFDQAPNGMLCAFKTSDGNITNFYYKNGNLVRIVQPGSQITDYAYDAFGRIIKVRDNLASDAIGAGIRTDDDSVTSQLEYDSLARIAAATAPSATAGATRLKHTLSYAPGVTNMRIDGASEPNGYSRRIQYDSLLRTTSNTDLTGKTDQTEWDSVKDLQLSTTDATGLKSTTIYDTLDRPVDSYGPAPAAWYGSDRRPLAAYTSQIPRTSTGYDEGISGMAVTVFNNAKLLGTPKLYDTGMAQTAEPSYEMSLTNSTVTPTDGLSMRATGKIKLNQTGTYTFRLYHGDGARLYIDNQLIVNNWSNGSERFSGEGTYVNDTAGKLVSITLEAYKTGTSGTGTNNRLAAVLHQKAPGQSSYNNVNLSQQLTPAYDLQTSTTAYDGQLGNVTSTTQYSNPAYGTIASTALDPTGLNYQSQATYEAPGTGFLRQTSKKLPGGATTTYQHYGANDTKDNPCTPETEAYHQAGRPKGKVDPSGRVTETIYNESGDVVATRYNTDSWTCTTYDARGQVTQTTIPVRTENGKTMAGRTITNDYAVGGNPLVTSTSDTNGTITVENDLLGRAIKYTDAKGKVTNNMYDSFGKLIKRTSPIGMENYYYDSFDRLERVALDGTTIAYVLYDQYSRVERVFYGATTNILSLSSITRDALGRENGNTYTLANSQTLTDQIERYTSGDIKQGTENGTSKSYSYDKAGRLTGATIGSNTYAYGFSAQNSSCTATPGYDAGKDGNRTSLTINGQSTTFCYNNGDQLVSSSDPTLTNAQYDSHGNTTSLGDATHKTELAYDASDRNTAIKAGDKETLFTRDAQGRVISREHKENNTTTSEVQYGFTGSGDTPDFLMDSNGDVKQKYLTLPGDVLVTVKTDSQGAGATTYSLPNIHGDVFATVNGAGALVNTFMTGPFGEVLPNQPAQPNGATGNTSTPSNAADGTTYGYVGQHQKMTDTDTSSITGGIIQMGARVYLPVLGRFLQLDPVEGGTDNNYAYVNDPVNDFDLDGNSWFGDAWNNTKKAVTQAAKWAWKNREGIATVASIGLMFVPGIGAAVGVARVAMTAYKIAKVAKAGGSLVKFGTVSARTSNLAGRIYTGIGSKVYKGVRISKDGLRGYRAPALKSTGPLKGSYASNFEKYVVRPISGKKLKYPNRILNNHLRIR